VAELEFWDAGKSVCLKKWTFSVNPNYRSKEILNGSRIFQIDRNKSLLSTIYFVFKTLFYLILILIKKSKFQTFRKHYLNLSKFIFRDYKKINGYDIYVVGSDQVWNCDIINYNEAYFLSFIGKNSYGVSYAASIGKDTLSEYETEFFSSRLKNFDMISVREHSTAKIIGNISKGRVFTVLDPTLIINKSKWKNLTSFSVEKNYILVYMLTNNEEVLKIAKNVSNRLKCKVKYINNSIKKNKYNFTNISGVGPLEFIDLFKNANFIVTNSFHGTAFSIIFQKDFITVPHKTRGTRMRELLNILKLDDRLIEKSDQISSKYNLEINYSAVQPILEVEIKESLEFLTRALMINNDYNGE